MSLPNPNPHLLFAEERDVIGSIILVSSFVFILLNLFIIKVLHDDKHLFSCTSYKFIIILCMYDLAQLLVHLSTGILTLFRSVGHPIFMKVLGLIATPSYICYVLTTIVLAFNRFVHIAAPNVDRKLFSPVASKFWILLCFLIGAGFSVALASPYATIQYDPDRFAWFYDMSLPASATVKQIEMIIEVGGIFVSAAVYILIVGFLCVWFSKSQFPLSEKLTVEAKILLQCFFLTAYCTVLNWLWHRHNITDLSNLCLNLMWIFNGGVNPAIYLILNTVIKKSGRVGISTIFSAYNPTNPVPITPEERKKEFKATVAQVTCKSKVTYVT